MIRTKEAYTKQLRRAMRRHPDCEVIMAELNVHIEGKFALLREQGIPEAKAVQTVIKQFGCPKTLAAQFNSVTTKSPHNAKLSFTLCNSFLFFLGACMTLGNQLLDEPVLQTTWDVLSENSWLILSFYTGYWALIGYQMGKAFGVNGKTLLFETIRLAIIPNLLLMGAVLYGLLPKEWFSPILTTSFTGACLVATILFYPISRIGYYFGLHRAV